MKKLALMGLTLGILLVGCSEKELSPQEEMLKLVEEKKAEHKEKLNSEYPEQMSAENMKSADWAATSRGVLNEDEWDSLDGEHNLLEMSRMSRENSAKAAQVYKHKIITVTGILSEIVEDGKNKFILDPVTKEEYSQSIDAGGELPFKKRSIGYVNRANQDKIAAKLAEKTLDEPITFRALVLTVDEDFEFEVIEIK